MISMETKLQCLSLLVLNLILLMPNTAESATTEGLDFIESSCKGTRYPAVCVQSLSDYAGKIGQSEQELAKAALTVSVSKTQSCASLLKKMKTGKGDKAVQDCIENMDDSVDRLNESEKEMGLVDKPEGKDFRWHMSNIKTWVSTAITDQTTCLEAFGESDLDANMRASVVDASQVTSNALALLNRFASETTS